MVRTVEEIGARMDALGIWPTICRYHWAIKARGVAFPYFCSAMMGDRPTVKARFLLIEGWDTFHNFIRTRLDSNFGYYFSPMDVNHFELIVLANGFVRLLHDEAGYIPREANPSEREFCAKLLWEAYGVMLRVETDPQLPLRFAGDRALFARVEQPDGTWADTALEIPPPRPYVENIRLLKTDIAKAKDLPMATGEAIELDFVPSRIVSEVCGRHRSVYLLAAVDSKTGERWLWSKTAISGDMGIKELWEMMPSRVLARCVEAGRVPGEIRLRSGRAFRMLRVLCVDIPFKLSLHDSLPRLESELRI